MKPGKNWMCTKNSPLNTLNYLNRLEGRLINLEYNWNGQFFVQMKIGKFVDVNQNNLEITFKIMKTIPEIYWKTWENHGKIMEFCQSGKVRTLRLWYRGNSVALHKQKRLKIEKYGNIINC